MISVRLKNRSTYKIQILPGKDEEQDKFRLSDLPVKRSVFEQLANGVCLLDHTEVPRADIAEILENFPQDDIIAAEDGFWRDVEIFERYSRPLADHFLSVSEMKGHIFNSPGPVRKEGIVRLSDYGVIYPPKRADGSQYFDTFQLEYILASSSIKRSSCCFNTGLGKSACTLSRAWWLDFKHLLILTPGSVWDEWEDSCRLLLNMEHLSFHGSAHVRSRLAERIRRERPPIVIAPYSTCDELPLRLFDSFILDEAHLWQNWKTKLFRERVLPVIKASRGKVYQQATATPMGNEPANTWALNYAIHPFLAGTKAAFLRKFQRFETFQNRDGSTYRKSVEPLNQDELRKRLGAHMALKDKREVVSYKPVDKIREIDMTEAQLEFYQEIRDKCVAMLDDMHRIRTTDARTQITRLRQASEGLFNFVPGNRESGKLNYLERAFDRAIEKRRKIINWSCFKPIGYELQQRFPEHVVLYNGDLNKDQRKLAKRSFTGCADKQARKEFAILQEKYEWPFDPGQAMALCGIIHQQTSLGMNLPNCDYQFYSSISFSGYAMLQTDDRNKRLESPFEVITSCYLMSPDTWDKYVLDYVQRKLLNAKTTVDGYESLSRRQYIELLLLLQNYG